MAENERSMLDALIEELEDVRKTRDENDAYKERTDTASYENSGLRARIRMLEAKCAALELHYSTKNLLSPTDIDFLAEVQAEIRFKTTLGAGSKITIKSRSRTLAEVRRHGDAATALKEAVSKCRPVEV